MSESRHIVFLGASYAGLGAAHYFLKHVYPHLPVQGKITYRVILIDPSTHWFQRVSAPRAVASKTLMPDEKTFLEIEPGFKQYGDEFSFIQGKATSWDPEARTVEITRADGKDETVLYHALVLATGTRTYSPALSSQGRPHHEVQDALSTLNGQLKNAKSIVIAGGGPAGVETAGEIGELLNGAAGWFSSYPSDPKAKVTLFTSSEKLLPVLRPALSQQAEAYLNRVGVDVLYNTRLSSTSTTRDGKIKIDLEGGKTMEAEVFIPAMGVVPLSDYIPAHLKTDKGYVKMNAETLRVDEAGPRVYAIGDIGSAFRGGVMDILDGTPVVMSNIRRDLVAAHYNLEAKPTGLDRIYKPNMTETQLVPVGQSKGVGAVFGWRLPSFFVWMIKGRNYMVDNGPGMINGNRWKKEVGWKPTDA